MGRIYVRPQDRDFTYIRESRPGGAVPAGALGQHNIRGCQATDFMAGNCRPGEEQEMFVGVRRLEAGMVNPLHRFDQPDLICVLSGRMIMGGAESDEGVELPAGSIVYLEANEDFWFKAPEDGAVEFMVAFPRAARYHDSRAD